MKKALAFLDKMKKLGLVHDYAVGGAMATLFYTEPFLTYDLDVFVIVNASPKGIILLSPIFDYAKREGYAWKGEHIIIDDLPVQILAAEGLEGEAVTNANVLSALGIATRVISPEYLIAIFLKAGRRKDHEKIGRLLEHAKLDKGKLKNILKKHGLTQKWREHGQD